MKYISVQYKKKIGWEAAFIHYIQIPTLIARIVSRRTSSLSNDVRFNNHANFESGEEKVDILYFSSHYDLQVLNTIFHDYTFFYMNALDNWQARYVQNLLI